MASGLYICPTPIGNMEDITLRVVNTLKSVSFIIAEDTRRTGNLLKRHGIEKSMVVFNDHRNEARANAIIERLKMGEDAALVSDSGTPGISDPGFYLVRACIENGIAVYSLPGPNALITALVGSGLPTDKFIFCGFVPKKEKKIRDLAEVMKKENMTFIFYESPYRLNKTLKALAGLIPEKNAVVARELTKVHEEFIRGSILELYEKLKDKKIKGEIVLLIH